MWLDMADSGVRALATLMQNKSKIKANYFWVNV